MHRSGPDRTDSGAVDDHRSLLGALFGRRRSEIFRRRQVLVAIVVALIIGIVIGLGAAGAALYLLMPVPAPQWSATSQASVAYFAGGREELGRFGMFDRKVIPIERVPMHVRDAVIAAENRSFYDDAGISLTGIARALWTNLTSSERQGGSTITQQYVRNYYLSQEARLSRKLKEAVLALKIDDQLSKNEILERYLNTVYFGRGAYGVQAAARAYFGVGAHRLTTAQGAALAALLASPGRFDPVVHRARLAARMRYVLDGMVKLGKLSQRAGAAQKLPKFVRPKTRYGGTKGYILAAIEAELARRGVPPALLHAGGLRVETTIRKNVQSAAEVAVKSIAPRAPGLRTGLAAVEPGTGAIVAMYGGADYLSGRPYSAENNAGTKVQPGSTYKTFALAAALQRGMSLYDTFSGMSPLRMHGQPPVHNAGNKDWGRRVSLLAATQYSINTAYVDLANRIGAERIARAATSAGIPMHDMEGNVNSRLVLGINAVSPMQMAGAYATFAADGVRADPHLVASVIDPDDEPVPLPEIETSYAFTPQVAHGVTYALERVLTAGTAYAGTRGLGLPAAAKTGTHAGRSGEALTAWLVGYTPRLSTAVAMFKRDGTEALGPIGTGGGYPARIWTAFMSAALTDRDSSPLANPEPGDAGRPAVARPGGALLPSTSARTAPSFTPAAPPTTTQAPAPSRTLLPTLPEPTLIP